MRAFYTTVLLSLLLMPSAQAEEAMVVPSVPISLLQAAQAGDADSQLQIGVLFEYGFYMKDNMPYALAWYTLSAERGSAKAATYRDKLLQKLSPEEIDRADTLAKGFGVAAPQTSPASQPPKPEDKQPAQPTVPAPG